MVRFSVALVGTVVCCVEASLGGEPNIFRYITLEGKRRVDEKLPLGTIDFFRCQKCCTHYAAKVHLHPLYFRFLLLGTAVGANVILKLWTAKNQSPIQSISARVDNVSRSRNRRKEARKSKK